MNSIRSVNKYFSFFRDTNVLKGFKLFLCLFLIILDLSALDSLLFSGKKSYTGEILILVVSAFVFTYLGISLIAKRSKKKPIAASEEVVNQAFTDINPFKKKN